MSKYKVALWDLDDTLINTSTAMELVCFDIAKEMDIDISELNFKSFAEFDADFWFNYKMGRITVHQDIADDICSAEEYLRAHRFYSFFGNISFNDAKEFNQRYQNSLKYYEELENAKEVVEYIDSLNIKQCIATNGPVDLALIKLDLLNIKDYIKDVFCHENLGCNKPNPLFFHRILKRLDNPEKYETIIVGDSLYFDIHAGDNFGIDTCWYNPREKEVEEVMPTYEISNLIQLKKIIK